MPSIEVGADVRMKRALNCWPWVFVSLPDVTLRVSAEYRKAMQSAGFKASMSRKGDCYDNAPMESFFHTLKTELVHHRQYATRTEAKRDIFAYIEGFYNRTRRHSAIGYISPIEMELKAA